ncbi:MAG TPA: ribonuclease H-like domain-containing protein [Symbiobacteriaceae bacterium]|nr:ribonuclease H-like domain-containing protein [Symbiobacteriaceae bacterium]
MNLKDRLRMLKAAGAARNERPPEPVEEFSPPIGAGAKAAPEPRPYTAEPGGPAVPALAGGLIAGYAVAVNAGEAFYVETRYPVEYCRGPLALEYCFEIPGLGWQLLGRVPEHVHLRRAAFFDTETTGLAGGTGTYAFLAGLGYFEGYDFVVRQYFLRDYPEEDAMLEALAADLAKFDLLVSFNGKAFDWPLMETRYRLARRRVPLSGAPHLDLLHPARRIWKERLQQCNLQNLEAKVLGVERVGDVPGEMIPALYFDYLRTGEAGPLEDVILHNRMDIVSLVSLAGWMGHMVTAPLDPTPDGELVCGDDLFSLGRLFADRGDPGQAIACFEAALERGLETVTEARAQRALSSVYKRVKEHDRAVAIWQEMLAGPGGLSLFPYVELAKYYEHVVKDVATAREMAVQALAIAERRRSLAGAYGPTTLKDLEDVQHRLGRLNRKLGAS